VALGVTRPPSRPDPPPEASSLEHPGRDREVDRVVVAQPSRDGAGVNLRRALGGAALSMLDPFLLLDEIKSDDPNDYAAGFPDHPHRGFETVTYMVHGAMEHRDSVGNQGRLGPGTAQWMTAGHGIVHSEMPRQERGLMWGFQLWVNLPATSKMKPPRYQDVPAERIPELEREGARVRVVAGSAFGAVGPVRGIDVAPLFLDLAIPPRARLAHPVAPGHRAFAYVTEGAVRVGAARREVAERSIAVLSDGDVVRWEGAEGGGRVLLLAGRPLGEPVARYGPFVMNTEDEIRTAIADYRSGRLVVL
jgi:redox-sensitive bicupin YhaK (pirin superfamily)